MKNRQPWNILWNRIELRPKTTKNKRMQTVLKELGEVIYYIETWLVFLCSTFCLMEDFFFPKTFFSCLVCISSQLCITSKNIEGTELFFILFFYLERRGQGHAYSDSILYNNDEQCEHIYILIPDYKDHQKFFGHQSIPQALLATHFLYFSR